MAKKCPHPHCGKLLDMQLIVRHAESYGGSNSKILCPHCNKGVNCYSRVQVVIELEPYYGPATTGSWGEEIPASP